MSRRRVGRQTVATVVGHGVSPFGMPVPREVPGVDGSELGVPGYRHGRLRASVGPLVAYEQRDGA